MMICSQGREEKLEFVRWMLEKGADPNQAMNSTGWTAMHSAAKAGNSKVIRKHKMVLVLIEPMVLVLSWSYDLGGLSLGCLSREVIGPDV